MVESSANTTTALPAEPGIQIRAAGEECVPSALLILREASQWLTRRGLSGWSDLELQNADLPRQCAEGALILGYQGENPLACMLLQREDPIYWPTAAPGSALYLHKLAVRRAQAGRGWGARMIAWARAESQRLGIERLRLDTWADSRLSEFYSRHGFHLVDRVFKPEDGMMMCRMECLLTCKHL